MSADADSPVQSASPPPVPAKSRVVKDYAELLKEAQKPTSPPVVPEYERRPIPFRGKASKEFVRRMIATGRYTVKTLDGTPITDWKLLFKDIHELSAVEALDGDKSLPVTDVVQPSPPVIQVPRAGQIPVQSPAVIVGSKKYTNRQLEHFGDAIVALTGRVMVHELCSTDQRLYFDFSGQLIRNKNLGHGDVRRGSAAEVLRANVRAMKRNIKERLGL